MPPPQTKEGLREALERVRQVEVELSAQLQRLEAEYANIDRLASNVRSERAALELQIAALPHLRSARDLSPQAQGLLRQLGKSMSPRSHCRPAKALEELEKWGLVEGKRLSSITAKGQKYITALETWGSTDAG